MKNNYIIKNDMVIIYLNNRNKTQIFECIIDIEDFEKIDAYNVKWFPKWQHTSKVYHPSASKYLGLVNGKYMSKSLYLSRIIMDAKRGEWVDHIDHNPMNNIKNNLRKVTNAENLKNRSGKNSNNTTGYRNVSNYNGEYLVQLQIDGKNTLLKKFHDVKSAGDYAEKMRKKYYGEFSGNE